MTQVAYCVEQLKKLCAIDSPSGFTERAADYLLEELTALGYAPKKTRKGGVAVCLGGEAADQKEPDGLLLMAHVDTLGAVVQSIKGNGLRGGAVHQGKRAAAAFPGGRPSGTEL